MEKLKNYLIYLLAKIGVMVAGFLSDKQAFAFGRFLGKWAGRLLKSRHKVAYENLKHAFGNEYSDYEYHELILEVFQNIGCSMIEFCRFRKLNEERIKRIMVCDNLEILRKVRGENRGAIIVTAHFGNWEMLNPFFSVQGYPIDAIVTTQHNEFIDKMITGFRNSFEIGLIRVGSSNYRRIFKNLRDNRFIIIASDQHDPSESLIMPFFRRNAAIARGPALFACKNNCPIIVILNNRINFDRHEVMISEPIYPPNSGDIDNDVKIMTQLYVKQLEEKIRNHPGQWMWTHKRWKL